MIVYPVPLIGTALGGSHSSVTLDGRIKLGPAMIPCHAFEDYDGQFVEDEKSLSFREILESLKNSDVHKTFF